MTRTDYVCPKEFEDEDAVTPLLLVQNSLRQTKKLLRFGADIHCFLYQRDYFGKHAKYTLFHYTVRYANVSMVRLLLRLGADFTMPAENFFISYQKQVTPLEMIKILIETHDSQIPLGLTLDQVAQEKIRKQQTLQLLERAFTKQKMGVFCFAFQIFFKAKRLVYF